MRWHISATLALVLAVQGSGSAVARSDPQGLGPEIVAAASGPKRSVSHRRKQFVQPKINHTPVPRRPFPDYSSPLRYSKLIPKPDGFVRKWAAIHPVDLTKLQRVNSKTIRAHTNKASQSTVNNALRAAAQFDKRVASPSLTTSATGVLPWWPYASRLIPGLGVAMANVTNLNFLLAESDVAIPGGELGLNFTRIYNSESQHDWQNDDDSTPSVFGNRWTNNLDVHLGWVSTGLVTGTIGDEGRPHQSKSTSRGQLVDRHQR